MEWLPLAQAALTVKLMPFRRHRRVHRLENERLAEQGGVVFLHHNALRLNHRLGRGIVAEDAAYFVGVEVFIGHTRHFQGLRTGHKRIFRLFGQSPAKMTVNHPFQGRFGNDARQGRLEAILQALRIDADAGFAGIKRILDLPDARSEAGPDSHSRNNNPSHLRTIPR